MYLFPFREFVPARPDNGSAVVALTPYIKTIRMTVVLFLHSLLRWVILVLLLVMIARTYAGMGSGKVYSGTDRRLGLFLTIFSHTTLVLGLILWLFGAMGLALVRDPGMGVVTKNAAMRFYVMEHTVMMLIAIILITIAGTVGKKSIPDAKKFRRAFWLYLVALIVILVMIPWPFRAGLGRPWL